MSWNHGGYGKWNVLFRLTAICIVIYIIFYDQQNQTILAHRAQLWSGTP